MSDSAITAPAVKSPPIPTEPVVLELPDEPVTRIQRSKSWSFPDIGEIWAHRELMFFLVLRDLKVRYKQTVLGVAWVIMQPLMMTLIFSVFLGKLARVPSDGRPYALFVFAGMLPWLFFSGSILASGNSLVSSASLITKVYFPRIIIPAAAVVGRLVDLLISFIVFGGMLLYYQVGLSRNLLILPVLIILMALLSLAIGMWAAAVNVKYRDIAVALPVLMQFWMFVSPVIYPSSMVYSQGGAWRSLYSLNPMVGIIDNFRAAILGGPFNWVALIVSAVITTIFLSYASYEFRRLETTFADTI